LKSIILFTQISQTMLQVALQEIWHNSENCLVVDTDDSIHAILEQYAISSMPLRAQGKVNWSKRDSAFRELCMPGKQLGISFPTTELPIWKVIAMDRLNFWYLGDLISSWYKYLLALDWQKAYVSADLHNPLGWALAKHSGRQVVGVKAASLRTREWYDMLHTGGIPFSALITEKESDMRFLKDNGYEREVLQAY